MESVMEPEPLLFDDDFEEDFDVVVVVFSVVLLFEDLELLDVDESPSLSASSELFELLLLLELLLFSESSELSASSEL